MNLASPELAKTISALVASLRPELCTDAEEWRLAKELTALPICVSLYSHVLLLPDCTTVMTGHEPGEFDYETDANSLLRTLVIGSKRWPQLADHIPIRTGPACAICSGTGQWGNMVPGTCPGCAGLGWVMDNA